MNEKPLRPLVTSYLDPREFLIAWLENERKVSANFSLRSFARKVGVSAGLFPMIMNRKRNLTLALIDRVAPHLHLEPEEQKRLRELVQFSEQESMDEKEASFGVIRASDEESFRVVEYFSKWFLVTVRELSISRGFLANTEWVLGRLLLPVSERVLQRGIDFLVREGFIAQDQSGKWGPSDRRLISCPPEVYRTGLLAYHREMLNQAITVCDEVPRERRVLEGVTIAVSEESYRKILEHLTRSMAEAIEIARSSEEKSIVVHIGVTGFPLTKATNS